MTTDGIGQAAVETAQERYLRFLGEVQECFEEANESDEWDDPETLFWQYRARTWAILAQGAAIMCLAEATAAKDIQRTHSLLPGMRDYMAANLMAHNATLDDGAALDSSQ